MHRPSSLPVAFLRQLEQLDQQHSARLPLQQQGESQQAAANQPGAHERQTYELEQKAAQQKWEAARMADQEQWEQRQAQRQQEFLLRRQREQREFELQQAQELQRWQQHRQVQQMLWEKWQQQDRGEWEARQVAKQAQQQKRKRQELDGEGSACRPAPPVRTAAGGAAATGLEWMAAPERSGECGGAGAAPSQRASEPPGRASDNTAGSSQPCETPLWPSLASAAKLLPQQQQQQQRPPPLAPPPPLPHPAPPPPAQQRHQQQQQQAAAQREDDAAVGLRWEELLSPLQAHHVLEADQALAEWSPAAEALHLHPLAEQGQAHACQEAPPGGQSQPEAQQWEAAKRLLSCVGTEPQRVRWEGERGQAGQAGQAPLPLPPSSAGPTLSPMLGSGVDDWWLGAP